MATRKTRCGMRPANSRRARNAIAAVVRGGALLKSVRPTKAGKPYQHRKPLTTKPATCRRKPETVNMQNDSQRPATVAEAPAQGTLAALTGSEILACPHCLKTTEDKDRYTDTRAVMATTYTENHACVVQCNWCGLSGPICDSITEAIAVWNGLPRKSPNAEVSHSRPTATVADTKNV